MNCCPKGPASSLLILASSLGQITLRSLHAFIFRLYNGSFPGGLDGKESVYNAGDLVSIPGSGRSPREENGNPLQHSCLENPMDRGAWQATVHGVTKSWTQLSN